MLRSETCHCPCVGCATTGQAPTASRSDLQLSCCCNHVLYSAAEPFSRMAATMMASCRVCYVSAKQHHLPALQACKMHVFMEDWLTPWWLVQGACVCGTGRTSKIQTQNDH